MKNRIKILKELIIGYLKYNVVSVFRELKPSILMINLTYKCNSRCIMCNIWKIRPKKEMTIDDWHKIAKDPIFKGIRSLTISGGEAFLFIKYVETVESFLNSMPKINRLALITNGFATERIIKTVSKIAKICKRRNIKLTVCVSVDGVDEVHNAIRGIKGGLKRTLKTIEDLKKIKEKNSFNINIGSLLLKQNIDKFEETEKLLEKIGVNYNFQLVGFHKSFLNNLKTEKKVGFEFGVKKKLFQILEYLSQRKGWKKLDKYYWADMKNLYSGGRRTTPCPFLKDGLSIDGFGDVYYCLSVKPIGNFIKEQRTINQIYFDPKNIRFRKSLWKNNCGKCNSACKVTDSLAFDLKKYLWFLISGKLWR